jgi:hypothetical protein
LGGIVTSSAVERQLAAQHFRLAFAQHELQSLLAVVGANQRKFGLILTSDLTHTRAHGGASLLQRRAQRIRSAGRQVEGVKASQPQHSRSA